MQFAVRLRLVPLLAVSLLLAACSSAGAPEPSELASPTAPGACVELPAPADLPVEWTSTSTSASVIPVIVSSEQACGSDRFVFSLIDAVANTPVASPDRSARVAFYNLGRDPATPVAEAEGTFVWGIEGSRGVYVVPFSYPDAGEWGVALTTAAPGGPEETIRVRYQVRADRSAVGVGEPAVPVRTPTLDDVGGDVEKISSDPDPDPAFYTTSVDAAIEAGEPFVLAFATPAFCLSAQCGPTLDVVKAVAAANPGFLVINVEPYQLEFADGRLQPIRDENGQLQPAEATNEWGILSEPWVYVVDGDGVVVGSLEGILSEAELQAAVDAAK
jgi:hypothetical protein